MTEISQAITNAGRCVVMVHGHDFKPAQAELMSLWLQGIETGLQRDRPDSLERFQAVSKEMAYFGDLTKSLLMEKGKTFDEQLDIADRRNAHQLLCAYDKRKSFSSANYDRLPGKSAASEFVADLAAPLLFASGLSVQVISKMAPDIGEYWKQDSDFGRAVRVRVVEQIKAAMDRCDRILLLCHGFGSIVAYDALWQLSRGPKLSHRYYGRKVDTWITMGSPLGDETFKHHLLGARLTEPMRYPNSVLTWYNASAEDDYMCHDKKIADDFKTMLSQRLVSRIQDYRIYNLAVRYGKSNPHSSAGYLMHPRVIRLIADWLE